MSRQKSSVQAGRARKASKQEGQVSRREAFNDLIKFVKADGTLFSKQQFHGNTKWMPEQLAAQALIWSWQDTTKVTDAFEKTLEICEKLGLNKAAKTYTVFMNALSSNRHALREGLRIKCQAWAEKIGGEYFRANKRVLIGFDGSRATAPRSVANERAFCAPNYGFGKKARYGKKKSKGLRPLLDTDAKPAQPEPQIWLTMMWHMSMRLPWTWRVGRSNASERSHVQEILEQEEFPENTLFCGDAGFVGYPLWSSICRAGADFLVRVGGNVDLLSEHADVQKHEGGLVLCWPKDRMQSGDPPLRLRLVRVLVGKTAMWMLTNIIDARELTKKQIVEYYKLRWLIEVEFRGLKQTIDKRKLRCRNAGRLLSELDWSLQGMAFAELLAMRAQIPCAEKANRKFQCGDRSLANTLRVLRRTMTNLDELISRDSLMKELSKATVQRYNNRTDKRARYRPKNPDIKPLGDPTIRKLTPAERKRLRSHELKTAV